jgi:hypothetical protein
VRDLKLWSSEENFFILEILPERMNALLVGVDGEKKLMPRRSWDGTTWAELGGPFGLKRFTKNIIIAADSRLAYTAIVPVRIVRENPNVSLYATELENLLAQEVGKVFNRCRMEAGKELGLDDLDVVLAHSRVGDFRIDGHHVLNPIGLKAHRMEAVLELMLTTRSLLEDIKKFLKGRQYYFFTEIGRAELAVLSKTEKLPIRLLRLGSPSSSLLEMDEGIVGNLIERQRIDWDVASLGRTIAEEWGVAEPVALELYASYLRRDMGPAAAKLFTKRLGLAVAPLFDELKTAHLRGRTFVESPLPLPLELPLKKGNAELRYPLLDPILARSGFTIEPREWPVPEHALFARLAPFFAYYHDRSDSTVNRWLRRHLNWLGAPMGHG